MIMKKNLGLGVRDKFLKRIYLIENEGKLEKN